MHLKLGPNPTGKYACLENTPYFLGSSTIFLQGMHPSCEICHCRQTLKMAFLEDDRTERDLGHHKYTMSLRKTTQESESFICKRRARKRHWNLKITQPSEEKKTQQMFMKVISM